MSAAAIEALIILAAKYGPPLVLDIIALFKKENPTVQDVETLFGTIKKYEDYGINPPPTAPIVPAAK